MESIRFPTLVLFGALLACGGPEIDLSESTCNGDDDCPKGETCSQSIFGGYSCSPPYQAPSSGAGGAGASAGSGGFAGFVPIGGTGSGGFVCGGQPCEAPNMPGLEVEPCCLFGVRCGALILALSSQCIELDQPGDLAPSCPGQLLVGEQLPGCCKPSGWCGVLHPELGCANPVELGGVPAPPCVQIDPGGIDPSPDAGDADPDASGD